MSFVDRLLGRTPESEPDTEPPAADRAEPARPQPGDLYEGPKCYTTDPLIGRPGFYALADPEFEDDGESIASHPILEPHLMLTWIDAAPHDEEDGSGYFVVADPLKPYYSHTPPHTVDEGRIVELEAQAKTTSKVSMG